MSSDEDNHSPPPPTPPAGPPAPSRRLSVRFSTDQPRTIPAPIETSRVSGVGGIFNFSASLSTSAAAPGDAPVSPRHRNRGYSLRRQLFFRNAAATGEDRSSLAHTSSSDTMELGRLTTSPSPPDMRKTLAEDEELVYHGNPPRRGRLRRWWKELGVNDRYEYVRKTIFREHEIPPSKDGRKIPLRAQHKETLIDERTGGHYVNNTVCWAARILRRRRNRKGLGADFDGNDRSGAVDIRCGIFYQNNCFISFRNWRICM
jgi:hypothetical protein